MRFTKKEKDAVAAENVSCPGFANPKPEAEYVPQIKWDAPKLPEVKFNELNILKEIERYVLATYNQHYVGHAGNKTQVMDLLMANPPTALEFSRGAAVKYLMRYGKKSGHNRVDLLKAAHYIMFMLKCDEDIHEAE